MEVLLMEGCRGLGPVLTLKWCAIYFDRGFDRNKLIGGAYFGRHLKVHIPKSELYFRGTHKFYGKDLICHRFQYAIVVFEKIRYAIVSESSLQNQWSLLSTEKSQCLTNSTES